jgi:tRNA uridine 5-carbamoylmethylation protein Kti12
MASITIITGCPGSGKTTLSAQMAQILPKGVHLHADHFYDYIAQKISPILPESHQQNTTVMRAIASATAAYVMGDYNVVVDGIFGPWFLPTLAEEFQLLTCPVNYVVIRLPLEETILRATTRLKNPAREEIIRHMYPLFNNLGEFERYVFEVGVSASEDILIDLNQRCQSGEFRLNWSLVTQ